MIKEVEVSVEIDLEEFSDEELCAELEERGFYTGNGSCLWHDLAELVARGENRDALELIEKMSGGEVNAITALNIAKLQMDCRSAA